MTSDIAHSAQSIRPDDFKLGRILALQPEMEAADLRDGVLETEDPIVVQHLMENLIQIWAVSRRDLPQDFLELVQVLRVQRQPLMITTIAVQHVSRRLTESYEPSDGTDVDQKRWATQDLMKLVPVETMKFPDQATNSKERLNGNEEVRICSDCKGAKANECAECAAAGELACPTCEGNKQRACPQCNGSGSVLGVRGNMIQCRACNTKGTIKCIECNKQGMVPCAACKGAGSISCNTCAGQGQEKRFWTLHTLTQTRFARDAKMHEPWPLATEVLDRDTRVVLETEWEWPAAKDLARNLAKSLPEQIAALVQARIVDLLASKPATDTKAAGDSALRVRVYGSYLYRVEFGYKDFQGLIFVGGDSNRVFFANQIPTPQLGLLRRFGRWLMSIAATLNGNLRPDVDRNYIKSVQGGKCHIADSLCLGSELATTYELQVTVTPGGYQFILPHDARISGTFDPVPLEVAFEVDDTQGLVLAIVHRLGPAHRDLFPKALALNHKLRFGRIGVTLSEDGSEEIFQFVDRQPYASLRTDQYYVILREVECVIGEILTAGILA